MLIPSEIKVNGLIWKVEESQDVANEGDCFGSSHYRSQKIFIEKSSTKQMQESTFLHELLHVIFYQVGLAERFKKSISGITEEELIATIEPTLFQVLQDNNLLK